ncbi:hypothetical protein ACFVGN_18475 [Streptomyces sp. NPDC057757]|uniref:hypothetical protein n=1 Tax=Streptomyces sp. NPDC057757 TaxID=3346241 RepID=UPI0036BEEBD8
MDSPAPAGAPSAAAPTTVFSVFSVFSVRDGIPPRTAAPGARPAAGPLGTAPPALAAVRGGRAGRGRGRAAG